MDEPPVDFVAVDPGADGAGHVDDGLEKGAFHEGSRGVVGVVDADEARLFRDEGFQPLHVGEEGPFGLEGKELHRGAEGFGDGGELLVGGPDGDDFVAGLDEGVEGEEVGRRPSVHDEDVVATLARVESGHEIPQAVAAGDVAVGEAQGPDLFEKRLLPSRQIEKGLDGEGVDTGLGDVGDGVVFVGVHPLFDAEGSDFHRAEPPCPLPPRRRRISTRRSSSTLPPEMTRPTFFPARSRRPERRAATTVAAPPSMTS